MTSLKTSIKTITYLSDIGCLEIQGASLVLMIEYVFFISNLMSQLHIAPLFIFCLVLNDYHNALSVFGLIICYCFMLRFYCVVFYAFVVFLSI
ncbi:DNA methylase [Escherichia coli]|nr:DNA methylase [Escherichia coli]